VRDYEAQRLKSVPFSGIRRIMAEAGELEKNGASIVHMEIGRPDFDTPIHIKEAAKAALDRGEVHYTPNLGTLELRQAIARKLKSDNGLDYDPESEIMVTVGASEAVFLTAAALLNPDDELLVPDLGWVNYYSVPVIVGARLATFQVREEAAFRPEAAAVSSAVTPLTRMILLCSPGNPTGAVLQEREMDGIARLAQEHDLLVVADEIYEKLVYDGARHVSIASLPGMRERTLVINGFSKAYSMTGWRLGYVAAPKQLMSAMLKVHQNLTTCAASVAQAGAVAALQGPQDCVVAMVAEFQRRRDMLVKALNRMPGIRCTMPEGAFYVLPNVRAFGMTSGDLALYLLREAHIAVVPGTSFGPGGEGYLRISYANSYDQIQEGMERMATALERLPCGQ
jgi:aminotransferase